MNADDKQIMSIKKSMQTTKDSLGKDNGDEDMLQAALAESQRQMESNQSAQSGATEVLYNDGATPLFNAIEETKWTDALDLLEVVPEQASIWVASTGTENTTFGWSLWRRLPIHEVCSITQLAALNHHFAGHIFCPYPNKTLNVPHILSIACLLLPRHVVAKRQLGWWLLS